MLGSLSYQQYVALQVLINDIPGSLRAILHTPDAQALSLTVGVIHQSRMLADLFTFCCLDDSRLGRNILLEEIFELTLADEANAGAVFLVRSTKPKPCRNSPHLGFC